MQLNHIFKTTHQLFILSYKFTQEEDAYDARTHSCLKGEKFVSAVKNALIFDFFVSPVLVVESFLLLIKDSLIECVNTTRHTTCGGRHVHVKLITVGDEEVKKNKVL